MNDRAVLWLRISYWAGAILDLLAALTMLIPALFVVSNRLSSFVPEADYRYAMGMGAPLMLGWTVLLLWADRRPVERKSILLITLFPVVFGLVVNEVLAVQSGFLSAGALIPTWILQACLTTLFIFGYLNARSIEAK